MTLSVAESSFNELQQVQLRAQILVYGALLQGSLPEEPLMVGAFSDTSIQDSCWNDGRHIWEKSWRTASKKVREALAAELDASKSALIPAPQVQSMPTATRSALMIHPPSAFETLDDARGRKKAKLSDDRNGRSSEELEELEIQQVKRYVEDAEAVKKSISEHKESLHLLLQSQTYDAKMASVAIALEAAFSAAKAAVAVANIAYEAASQAQRFFTTINQVNTYEDGRISEEASSALGIAFTAVSQARTALKVGNSRSSQGDGDWKSHQDDHTMLTEGATVEVMSHRPGAWFTAKVLSVRDGIAHVVYNELFDDGKNHVTEWLPSDSRPPRIRFPYPSFDLNEKHDAEPKRWTVGDHIDARAEHSWREGIVVRVKSDEVEVFYPGEGCVESVKSANIRPSLLWKTDKWELWKCLHVEVVQEEEEAPSSPDFEIVAEHGETGPSPNYKMRKLVDVILEEESEAQRKREEKNKRLAAKRRMQRHSSKMKKAKSLIEKAAKSNTLQVSSSRLTRQFMRKLASASASSNSSKLVFAKGHQVLRQLAQLKASPRTSSFKDSTSKGDQQQRPSRLVQPTNKLLEGLKTALQGGIF